jgi:hypothetical protein
MTGGTAGDGRGPSGGERQVKYRSRAGARAIRPSRHW